MITIPKQILEAEAQYLIDDRELHMSRLNELPLAERKTESEIRDGLILYYHVYQQIINNDRSS